MLTERKRRHNGTKVLELADKLQRSWHLGNAGKEARKPHFQRFLSLQTRDIDIESGVT
jgi:hypothetical protein